MIEFIIGGIAGLVIAWVITVAYYRLNYYPILRWYNAHKTLLLELDYIENEVLKK